MSKRVKKSDVHDCKKGASINHVGELPGGREVPKVKWEEKGGGYIAVNCLLDII